MKDGDEKIVQVVVPANLTFSQALKFVNTALNGMIASMADRPGYYRAFRFVRTYLAGGQMIVEYATKLITHVYKTGR